MSSFYSESKKRSRQMTELILIGLVMVLYVIGSSWGTKLINYQKGSIALEEVYPRLLKDKLKDSFDVNDPHNQYVEIQADDQSMIPLRQIQKTNFIYYLYKSDHKKPILIGLHKKQDAECIEKLQNHQSIILQGGFDELDKREKIITEDLHADTFTKLIFRNGYIGDSKKIEITISIYSTILLLILIIIVILLEISGIYQHKVKKQLQALREDQRQAIDEDFRERLRKNRLGFGDQFLYVSRNWHYEIYPFEDIILLHYHVYRYGDINRYSLVAWDTSKHHVTLSSTLTKEKLHRYLKLIYERNPEITVENTTARKNMQLYYFDSLVKEMRDRQEITKQLLEVKQEESLIRTHHHRRTPIKRRIIESPIYRKRKSSRVIHTRKAPILQSER